MKRNKAYRFWRFGWEDDMYLRNPSGREYYFADAQFANTVRTLK